MNPHTLAALFVVPLLAAAPALASSLAHLELTHPARGPVFSTAFLWTGGDRVRDPGCDLPYTLTPSRVVSLATQGCSTFGVGLEAQIADCGATRLRATQRERLRFALILCAVAGRDLTRRSSGRPTSA